MTSISTGVVLVVLFSALIHASWNAILKSGSHKLIETTLLSFFAAVIAFVIILYLPVINVEAWPYVIVSTFVHVLYFTFLAKSYDHNDLSHAYPLMRGGAPPFVALFAFLIIGEALPLAVWVGILLISIGVLLPGRLKKGEVTFKSVLYIVATALCIIAYTLIDGLGVRVSDSVVSYVSYIFFFQGVILTTIMWFYVGRQKIISYASKRGAICAFAAAISMFGYFLVLWAMNQAPIGVVSALREISIIFGTLIGVYFFKEGFGKRRLVTAALICFGALLIKLY